MSLHNPTLAEFLAGNEILVLQERSQRLMAYSYVCSQKRMQFQVPNTETIYMSKRQYSVKEAMDIYHKITPKMRSTV